MQLLRRWKVPALKEAFPNTNHCILNYPFFPLVEFPLGRFHVGEWYCENQGGKLESGGGHCDKP